MAGRRLLGPLAALPAALVGGAVAASPDPAGPWVYELGQRLLYVHVPLLWVAYAGFLASAVAAVAILFRSLTGREAGARLGRWMRATNEVTAVYAAGGLAAGLAWSYEFVFDPLGDPKVLATAVLVAVLAGLWALAAGAPRGRGDVLVAALTVVGFAAVPASYLASVVLPTVHPNFASPSQGISSGMLALLGLATVGFAVLAALLAWTRVRLLRLEEVGPRW